MRRLCMLSLGFVLLFAAPTAPKSVSAQLAHGGITVTWGAVPQAASYRIYRGTRSHGESATPYASGIASLFFVNTRISKGVRYYYQVTAVGSGGESARSAEVSAISGTPPPQPKPTPTPNASHSSVNWGALLGISLLLLLGAGGAFFVWRGGTVARVTALLPAIRGGAKNVPLTPSPPPTTPFGAVANFPSSPYDDASPAYPPDVALPGTVFPGEGLVSRFGASVPPHVSVPTGALADPEPLNEIFGDADATFSSSATISGHPLLPNHMRQLDQGASPWPMAGGVARPPIDQPNDTRTLLFIIAGALIAVAFLAFIVYAYFASSGGNGNTGGNPALGGGTSTTAQQATVTAMPSPAPSPSPPVAVAPGIAIAAGGPGDGSFIADTDVNGGSTDTTHDHIDRGNVTNPAPEKVYQSERWGDNFTYTIPNLTPGANYTVRLHFAEIYFKQAGQRLFNVAINSAPVLQEFDIVAQAGGPDIALVREFPTTADASGQITIDFTDGSQNHPKISGIEIVPAS